MADEGGGVVVDHPPLPVHLAEEVGRLEIAEGETPQGSREEVLDETDDRDRAVDSNLEIRKPESDRRSVLEHRLEALANRLPSRENFPSRVHAPSRARVMPDAGHLLQIALLDRLVEEVVDGSDQFEIALRFQHGVVPGLDPSGGVGSLPRQAW